MDALEPLFIITLIVLSIFFGPHSLLLYLVRWYRDNYGRTKARNIFYSRVGVPCAGVITHRHFRNDGTMFFRYAYRPPNNRNMIYVRDYIREPKHESYPWTDDKVLVVLVVPGHCASGLEVRKLTEPVERYWRRIIFSTLVTLWVLVMMISREFPIGFPLSLLLPSIVYIACYKEDALFEKIDVNDLSDIAGQPMPEEGDGEVSPTTVQDLFRRDMLPSLEHAEAEISRHLQLLRGTNVGSFERALLKFYDRCRAPARTENDSNPSNADGGSTLVEATAFVSPLLGPYPNLGENGDSDMTLPLLPAEP